MRSRRGSDLGKNRRSGTAKPCGTGAGADAPDRGAGSAQVPLFDVAAPAAEALMALAPDRLAMLIAGGRRHYTTPVLALGDRASLAWLRRSHNPYRAEIEAVSRRLGEPGAALLNMSYEWSCTAGIASDPDGRGMRLRRTLDWPLAGLGRTVVVARQRGDAGEYCSVTWPGYVGVLTGMAPGRFAAAINQPPLRKIIRLLPLDWMIARRRLWQSRELPPSHLLRRVFDACRSFAEAKRMLIETPLCAPTFYSLVGVQPGEGCIIERTETAAAVRGAPCVVANHWTALPAAAMTAATTAPRGRHAGGGGGDRDDFARARPSSIRRPGWRSSPTRRPACCVCRAGRRTARLRRLLLPQTAA